MKLTDKIKEKLLRWVVVSGNDIAIPNFFVGDYEMDVFLLRPSGQIYEYEIKISRSDFKADFKKSIKYYKGDNSTKHAHIKSGIRECNRFFFVVPKNLITKEECPDYAGLMYFNDGKDFYSRSFIVVKNAPLIRKDSPKINLIDVCKKLAFRERNWLYKYKWEKKEKEELRVRYLALLPQNDIRRFIKTK